MSRPDGVTDALREEAARLLVPRWRQQIFGADPADLDPDKVDREVEQLWNDIGDANNPVHAFVLQYDWQTPEDHVAVILKATEGLGTPGDDPTAAWELAAEFEEKWADADERLRAIDTARQSNDPQAPAVNVDNLPLLVNPEFEEERQQNPGRHNRERAMALAREYWQLPNRDAPEGYELSRQAWLTTPDDLARNWELRQDEVRLHVAGAIPFDKVELTEAKAEWVVFGDSETMRALARADPVLFEHASKGHRDLMSNQAAKHHLLISDMGEQVARAVGDPSLLNQSIPSDARKLVVMQELVNMIVYGWDGIRSTRYDTPLNLSRLSTEQAVRFMDKQGNLGINPPGRGVELPALGLREGLSFGRNGPGGSGLPDAHVL